MEKKSSLEKFMIGLFVVIFISTISLMGYVVYQVNENGGVKETIIELGKEVKDIGRAISRG